MIKILLLFVDLGYSVINFLLKLEGGKMYLEKIEIVNYAIQEILGTNSTLFLNVRNLIMKEKKN